ncbi:hypothetical protein AFB00_12280 [Pseudonocardia sp. HH130630-07]|nr:hypothetical protein AFB00_12280 [Pseudonocardia sp. HH130630-07]
MESQGLILQSGVQLAGHVIIGRYQSMNECLDAAAREQKKRPGLTSCQEQPDGRHFLYADDGLTD